MYLEVEANIVPLFDVYRCYPVSVKDQRCMASEFIRAVMEVMTRSSVSRWKALHNMKLCFASPTSKQMKFVMVKYLPMRWVQDVEALLFICLARMCDVRD